jgi:hypothetical protein
MPGPRSADALPVLEVADDLLDALDGAGAAVLVAPPGTGKTTGVPAGAIAQPYLRVGSQTEFTTTATTAVISADGSFTWNRRINSHDVRVASTSCQRCACNARNAVHRRRFGCTPSKVLAFEVLRDDCR